MSINVLSAPHNFRPIEKQRRSACALLAVCAALGFSGAVTAATITVTTTADTSVNGDGCSLREAITAANTNVAVNECAAGSVSGVDAIAFNIPGSPSAVKTISLTSGTALPAITSPVLIDGLSQPGADCAAWPPSLRVQISNPTNFAARGLSLTASSAGSTIRGLVINGFNNETGDNFRSAILISTNDNHVECNFLGTNAAGTAAAANLRAVDIVSASGNTIGSDGVPKAYFARNLISGNRFGGVDTRGNAPSNNVIAGNYIGTDVTGTSAIGNNITAVSIGGNPGAATGNVVGYNGVGNTVLMRNVISGNTSTTSGFGIGVDMEVGAVANRVSGNYIGTDASGFVALPNTTGISLGSDTSVSGNLIGYDGSGDPLLERNVIAANTSSGIELSGVNGSTNNAVVGNFIGTNAGSTANLPNGFAGINMTNTSALIARNIVRGNPTGIRVAGFGASASTSLFRNGVPPIAGAANMDSANNCVNGNGNGVLTASINGAAIVPTTFENNWWGAANGPSGGGGSGDSVSSNVDYAPFLTSSPSGCLSVESNLALNVDVPDPAIAGTTISLAFHITNSGTATSSGGTVAGTIPANSSVVDAGPCSVSSGALSCPFGSVSVAATRDYNISVAVPASATGNLHFQFTAGGTEPDPVLSNNSFTLDRAISLSANVGTSISNGVSEMVAGAPATYVVGVSNAGPSDVLLADVLALQPPSFGAVAWTCVTTNNLGTCPSSGNGDIDADVNLPAGALLKFTINGTLAATATGSLTYVSSIVSPVNDPVTSNDTASDNDPIAVHGDLSIGIDPSRSYAITNSVARFVIVAANNGPSYVTGAQLTVPVPAGVTAVVWSCSVSAGSTCAGSGNGAVNDTLNLPPGGMVTYALSAITTGLQDFITAQATLSTPLGVTDPQTSNNVALTMVPVSLFRSGFEGSEAARLSVPHSSDAALTTQTVALLPEPDGLPQAVAIWRDDNLPVCVVLQRGAALGLQIQAWCKARATVWQVGPWLALPAGSERIQTLFAADGDVARLLLMDAAAQQLLPVE
jgi:CSLREA domain-containing protein